MIKFFRKIRQKMINDNKISKYLLYAFGEIILVVIGILIALSINNWNNGKLLIEKEKKHLIGIERDLKTNITLFEKLKNSQSNQIDKIDLVLKSIKEKEPYTLSFSKNLQAVKGIEEIEIITTGFNTLSSFGMDNIRTDSLRSEIVLLFDHEYPKNQSLFKDLGRIHHQSLVIPMMLKNFTNGKGAVPIPNNYQQLLENNEFVSMLGTRNNVKRALITYLDTMIKKSNILRIRIQDELERIN